ncbi:hypothetical protein ACFHWD_16340 [Clostridium sp. MT-14]|uniref:hypothetical protein n=1 Tax=Clostridium sp. MT-14 TaxID=3348360 RepID=UPI0035F2A556
MDFKKLQEEINGMAAEDLTEVAYKNFYSIVNFLNEMEKLKGEEVEVSFDGGISKLFGIPELNLEVKNDKIYFGNRDEDDNPCGFSIDLDNIWEVDKIPGGGYNIVMDNQEISILF